MVFETGSSFSTEGHVNWWTNRYLSAIFWRSFYTIVKKKRNVPFQTELGFAIERSYVYCP
jgi:hypothetical protein